MFTLRLARREDAANIRRLIWQVHINPFGLDWGRFFLAVDPVDRLLGCGQIKPHRDGSAELASIAVRTGFRRQGIARAVIERLLADTGRPVYLKCASPLQAFYERFGFRVIAPDEMPPTFRQEWRLFDRLKKILLKGMPGMLVMKLG
jgi:N-acetylglutamate synthase-like GNAT family acetyltransferase